MQSAPASTSVLFKFVFLASAFLALLASAVPSRAQTPMGSVEGTVTDASTHLALAGVRVDVQGSRETAFTDAAGHYAVQAVAAGNAQLLFSYVGYPGVSRNVVVAAGQRALLSLELGKTDSVLKMDAVTITATTAGTARAINEERAAVALTDVVASDAIGALPNKNLAEALERVPGIQIARDKGEGRFVNVRGLDPQYVGISMNGIRMSTSEKGSREAALDTISSALISSMEVNKVNTPDMEADAMGGSVNVVTRSGLDSAETQVTVSSGGNYAHQEDMKGGFNEAVIFGTPSVMGSGLALAIDAAADYRPFTVYSEPATGWSLVKSPTDGQAHWIVSSQDFRHYDAKRWRNGLSTGLDYKVGDTGKAWVRFFTTSYTERNNQWLTTFPFASGTVTALTDTTGTATIKAGGIIKSEAQITNNKREQSLVGGFEERFGEWKNTLTTAYTTGKYTRPTVTIAFANSTATAVSYGFSSPYDNVVTQLSGPALDNPSSYAFSTKSSYSNTTADMHEETVRDDLRRDFDASGVPAYVQVGAEYRNKNNDENTFKEAITSSPWTLPGNTMPDEVQDIAGGFANLRILPQAVQNFYTNQSNYGQSLTATTTYGGAFRALEQIGAGYGMAGVTIGKLKIVGGARVEDTHFWITGWQQETTKSGTVVISPVSYTKDYTIGVPSMVFTYEFTPTTIARASYSESIARPDYAGTVPGRTVNDTAQTASQGNPALPPLRSDSWDASLEQYYMPMGRVAVAGFYKSISNFMYQAQSGTDAATGYALSSYFTGPSAWIYGFELSWVQRLSFLPGFLNGFGLQGNAVLGNSRAFYPTRPGESLPFAGFANKSGNAAITYDTGGLHLQLAANYHGKRLESGSTIGTTSTVGGIVIPGSTQDQYEDSYVAIDFGGSYQIGSRWQIYLNGANLNNAPLKEYYGGTGSFKRIQTYESYGWSAEGGVRWHY